MRISDWSSDVCSSDLTPMRNGWMKCALACTALVAGLSTGAQAQTTLNWVTYKPQGAGDPQAITTQWFADEVERRTNAEYDVRQIGRAPCRGRVCQSG